MNVLIVGAGAGSWTIRGQQLGAAVGARVTSTPVAADWSWAEVVVLVKRAGRQWAEVAHQAGVPIVWDALDFWRQPDDNALGDGAAWDLLGRELGVVRPTLTIGATRAQAAAADGVYLPHHGRLELEPTPARETVQTVAYDGDARYLGQWAPVLDVECRRRGWTFVVNPPDLAAVDLLVAFRDGPFDGWMPRYWKSGVKLVNAIRAGRPVIGQPSAAWTDLQPLGTPVETFGELSDALDAWGPWGARDRVYADSLARAGDYTVEAVGRYYQQQIARVARRGISV